MEDFRENLEKLEIKQEAFRKETQETKTRPERLERTERVKSQEIIQGSGLYIGDTVEVNNPPKGQDNKGKICSKTKDNLIKLKPTKGKLIMNLPKNLMIL